MLRATLSIILEAVAFVAGLAGLLALITAAYVALHVI